MGRQSSLIKITGTLDDLSFYKTKDGHMVRMKGGVSGTRIKTDPAFARTRENMQKFAELNQAGKWIRSSLRSITSIGSDGRVVSRLVKQLAQVLKADTTNLRGFRKVGVGLSTTEGKTLLKSFNFNVQSVLSQVLKSNYQVDVASGIVTIPDCVAQQDLEYPAAATHCSIESGWSEINFSTGEITSSFSPPVSLVLDLTNSNVVLTPAQTPSGSGIVFIALKVSFLQKINGQLYPLNNGSLNAIEIVSVS